MTFPNLIRKLAARLEGSEADLKAALALIVVIDGQICELAYSEIRDILATEMRVRMLLVANGLIPPEDD